MNNKAQAADDWLRSSILDADGERWVYRRVASVLERRRWTSSVWFEVKPVDFPRMSPDELRHVAAVLEGKRCADKAQADDRRARALAEAHRQDSELLDELEQEYGDIRAGAKTWAELKAEVSRLSRVEQALREELYGVRQVQKASPEAQPEGG